MISRLPQNLLDILQISLLFFKLQPSSLYGECLLAHGITTLVLRISVFWPLSRASMRRGKYQSALEEDMAAYELLGERVASTSGF